MSEHVEAEILFKQLDPDGHISPEDMDRYINVLLDAAAIHVYKERVRHALWKEYPAKDQNFQIRVKSERAARSLERLERNPLDLLLDESIAQELKDNAIEEFLDIINYCTFAVRILKGQT